MYPRRLVFATFAAPLLLAACSRDNRSVECVDCFDGDESTPDQVGPETPVAQSPDPTTPEMGVGDVGSSAGSDEGQNPGDAPLVQPGTGADPGADGSDPGAEAPVEGGEPLIPVGTVENRGASCVVPALPEGNTLPITTGLPDPFTRLDGTPLTAKSDWLCRREEILQQAYKYIYGAKPPKPESVTGTVSSTQVTVNVEHNGQTRSFNAAVSLPDGTGPFPAVISFGGSGAANQMQDLGVAVINFNQGAIGGGDSGLFAELYGATSAGDLAAWAWGASRIIDVLETDSSIIDSSRLAVTGCSFLGKAALAAGALDERFALVVPVESGIGGVPSYKLVPQIEPNPTGAGDGPEQPQHAINNGWLPQGSLVGDFGRLPVDTHEILGLIAPRGLLILGNTGAEGQFYKNLDFRTEYATAIAGKEIFAALGYADNISYDSRNVMHCQYSTGSDQALQASVDKFLAGGSSTTGTFTTDWEGVRTLPDQFIDWTTPTLEGEL
jgi:hypothetical protein